MRLPAGPRSQCMSFLYRFLIPDSLLLGPQGVALGCHVVVPSGRRRDFKKDGIANTQASDAGSLPGQSRNERRVLGCGATKVQHGAQSTPITVHERDRVEPESRKGRRSADSIAG